MASVDELELLGVRSFDPNPANRQVIHFSKPLTVILGKNGAGKTTIIESLLNATTGKFPPGCGTEKASFVYDPKVVGEHSVKAQIRLKFTGRDEVPARVIRSYQVDTNGRKGNDKPKFFALETVISNLDSKSGNYVHAGYNASEADVRLRDLLGVSTAVLEHVIFCHQEDCNWPLGSASEVKSNFDAIFAATRYVAALDSLRENQKKYSRELKDFERMLIELREHRSQANELRESIAKKENDLRIVEMRSKGLEPQIEQLKAVATAFDSVKQRCEALSLESAQIDGRVHEKAAAISRMNLPPTKQSLEELMEMRRNFDNHMSQLEKDVQTKEAQLQLSEASRRQRQVDIVECNAKIAELHRESQHHKSICTQIQEIVCTVTPEFVLGEGQVDERSLTRAQETVRSHVHHAQQEFDEQQLHWRREADAAHGVLDGTLRAMDADSKEKELKERQISSLQLRISECRAQLQTLTVHADDVRSRSNECANLEAALRAVISRREQGAQFQAESALREAIRESNEELVKIRVELSDRKRTDALESKVPYLTAFIAERQQWVAAEIDSKILPLLRDSGRQVAAGAPLSSVVSIIDQFGEQKREALRRAEQEQLAFEREVASTAHIMEQRQQDIANLEREFQLHHARYVSAVGDTVPTEEFASRLLLAEEDQMKCCRHLSSVESMAKCYENFVSVAKNERLCVVCKRSLTEGGLADFVKLNEDRQRTTPEQLDRAKKELRRSQEVLKALKDAEPCVTNMSRIHAQLSEVKGVVRRLSQDLATKRARLADVANKRAELEANHQVAIELAACASQISSAADAIAQAQRELQSIAAQRSADSHHSSPLRRMSLQALEEKYDSLMTQQQELSTQLNALLQNATGGDELAIQGELTKKRGELMQLETSLSRARDIQLTLDAAEHERDEYRNRISEIGARRSELQAAADRQRASLERIKAEWAARENILRTSITEAERRSRTLDTLAPQAIHFLRTHQGTHGVLARSKESLRLAEAAAQSVEDEIHVLRTEIPKLRSVIGDQHRQFASLSEHIRCLELQRSLDDDQKQLAQVEQELEALKATRLSGVEKLLGQETSRQPVAQVRELVQKKISELERIRATQDGNVEAMQRELSSLRQRLSSEKYCDIDDRYSSVYIKLQTVEMAARDIDKYWKALDKAVQSYHQDKIQQVNAIIAELWRSIYRGSDIDTIELKSEVDGVSATAAGTSKRNYNYRVVMRRGANEIDMRAKCSAGQKVLASVVIRVALSEAFSCDCGVLALDEPTTNLDEDNARSLAEALRDLIATRKGAKNFQLIIITHDEQFVRALGSQSVDRFYFVHKDREGAFSRIVEKSFDQLFM